MDPFPLSFMVRPKCDCITSGFTGKTYWKNILLKEYHKVAVVRSGVSPGHLTDQHLSTLHQAVSDTIAINLEETQLHCERHSCM